ncbi:MAG: cyclic nucleotide-binding domain-containing protein [Mariprofundaceae bacterium]
MDEAQTKELQHKEVLYRQMVDLYPSEPKYLQRLVELLLQLDQEQEAIEKMRRLGKLYQKHGLKDLANSLKELRQSIAGNENDLNATLNPFLSNMKAEALNLLMRGAKRIRLAEGDTLIKQGDSDDSMYIVLEGDLAVLVLYRKRKNPTMIHILKEGEIVGEMAFLEGRVRSASVIANSKATVLKLTHKQILQCLLKFPEMGDSLRHESEFRKHLTAINGNKILVKLTNEAKEQLAIHAKTIHYPPFAVVSRSNKNLPWMGIMISGLIRIVAEDRLGQSHLLEPIKPGDTIADIAALREESIMADMVTVNDSAILQIPAEIFREVMNANPRVKNHLLESAAERIASTMVYIKKTK